jgi:hypothetical protein
VRTRYDFDPDTDFDAWRSYAWYPVTTPNSGDPRLDNTLLHARIQAAVDHTLAERGFEKASGGDPDFYVNYHLSTEHRLDFRTMDRVYFGGPRGHGWGGAGWGGIRWTETIVTEYEEGTLVIDFLSTSERVLAWRGSGARRIPRNLRSDRMTTLVNESVREILAQFPPRPRR